MAGKHEARWGNEDQGMAFAISPTVFFLKKNVSPLTPRRGGKTGFGNSSVRKGLTICAVKPSKGDKKKEPSKEKKKSKESKESKKRRESASAAALRKKPARKPSGSSDSDGSSSSGDVASAYSLGETLKESPSLNSTLMNAMRDYFGDDGREVQDYMKRPRNKKGKLMYRVVVVGSGEREVETMKALKESDVIMGLYYCADEAGTCNLQMSRYGRSATVSAKSSQEDVVRFAKWIVADAVFVGPDREGCIGRDRESELAAAGITVFPHDVSAAIANGSMGVLECLQVLAQEDKEAPSETLVE